MFNRVRAAFALAALMALPAGGCATAHEGYGPDEPQILSELPTNAPPGECYARVRVPGEPVGPPPMMMGAQWVMSPGAPGSPGPIWCLVPTGPVPVGPAPETVTRFGWIRVLCDKDATPERIDRVQHRLHDRGYYQGDFSGRYDAATAQAVTRFQSSAHIEHGGYLSLQTLQALDETDAYGPRVEAHQGQAYQGQAYRGEAYAPPPYPVQGYAGAYSYQSSGGYAYPPQGPAAPCQTCGYGAPPPPPPQVFAQPAYPCCAGGVGYSQGYQAYGQGFYGTPTPAYAASRASVIQNGWLMWSGKTRY